MEFLRQRSDSEGAFPEYYRTNDITDVKVSYYTHFQRVDSDTVILFSFVTDAIVLLSNREYQIIQKLKFEENMELYHALDDNGILIPKDMDEFSLLLRHRNHIEHSISQTLKVVVLPTTACNARCRYCIGHNNSVMTMTNDIAKQTIDYIVRAAEGYKNIKFDWYGGEPLVKSELITHICEEVHRRLPDISYTSVITTNLLLLNEDLIQKMINCWHIEKVNVTIDGDKKEHNSRKNYLNENFDGYSHTLDCIKQLLNRNIKVFCRYNIDHDNIGQLEAVVKEISVFTHSTHFYFFISPLRGENDRGYYTVSEYNELYYNTGKILNEHGIHNPIDSFVPKAVMRYCLAKSNNCIVIGPNGSIYRCNIDELNEQNAIGNICSGIVKNDAYYAYMNSSLDDKCVNCRFLPICQGGCPEQAKHETDSNSQCDKFKYKLDATSRLLAEFYSNTIMK